MLAIHRMGLNRSSKVSLPTFRHTPMRIGLHRVRPHALDLPVLDLDVREPLSHLVDDLRHLLRPEDDEHLLAVRPSAHAEVVRDCWGREQGVFDRFEVLGDFLEASESQRGGLITCSTGLWEG